ncbi:FKBP-type peptidyl-prolyl cis-trans isomerase N-terminal domain-containing protein [Serratia fonticola]|uniref:FKBP-type peptidyl-prolyl cis-trans isomerase N-terminal domain-containing protein n=1 Tax=Serratia fonticola TaxID=47917 RepID=UPI0021BD30AE|nr:FKBP-type peptidyl-prolyl cis-trans isomerase N-terminal domain-containing protein [Serratia fonticola]
MALPLGGVQAEGNGASEANALSSLETITRQVDEAPALLFLTPSQIEAVEPVKNHSKSASKSNAFTKSADDGTSARVREMKSQQATINQLRAKISGQEVTLEQLRKSQSQQQTTASELLRLQQTIKQSQQENAQLQQQLVALVKESTQQMQQIKLLQQDQRISGQLQQQLAAQSKDSEQKSEQLKQLQQTLQDKQQVNAQLQEQLAAQTKNNEQKVQQLANLQQNLQSKAKLQEQLAAQTMDNEHKSQDLKQLQQKLADVDKQQAANAATLTDPKTDQEKRDYAIGTALGDDILSLLDSKKSQGVDVNHRRVLAGVSDVINGQSKLSKEQIDKALHESELELDNQYKKIKGRNEQQGSLYIENFKKQARVIKSQQGFYYRVDYAGDSPIGEGEIVAVVVKESLTDGKVIKDMELAGTSISQPLSAYPPLFREALGKLKNHGSMTLVVPPALAYGDKGMLPDIPPGTTMVYNVRILDVQPVTAR